MYLNRVELYTIQSLVGSEGLEGFGKCMSRVFKGLREEYGTLHKFVGKASCRKEFIVKGCST